MGLSVVLSLKGCELVALRVIDFGTVPPLRSQTIWHALARSAGDQGPVTLSFMRPSAPYVGIGLHRNVAEINQAYCGENGLPVFRRQVGGGPVYLDNNQLFFQVAISRKELPASRQGAIRKLLAPFAQAFRAAGVAAELDRSGEISHLGAKVCGHGAGEIDDGVVVVGNLIERFDHGRAAAILNTGSEFVSEQLEQLMRRFVGSFDQSIDSDAFIQAAIEALANELGLDAVAGDLDEHEWESVREFDSLLGDPSWTASPEFAVPPLREIRVIKIRAGVFCAFRTSVEPTFFMSSVFGLIEHFVFDDVGLDSEFVGCDSNAVVESLQARGWISESDSGYLTSSGFLQREAVAR